jgi:hypothetical protein
MKKGIGLTVIAFAFFAAFFSNAAHAQTSAPNDLQFSIGVESGDPTGDARLGSKFSLGGTARIQYGFNNVLAATVTSGAYHFFAIKIPGTNKRYDSYGEIPIKAGLKAFFIPHVYVGFEAGETLEKTDSGPGPTRLLLSSALGYAVKHWDFAVHYESFSSTLPGDHFGIIELRSAYAFSLLKKK